ncbi:PIN domain-containing protein [Thermosulfurimonas sp. F29]|uniref:type II toxin-antitoxin system VapC family toxin n=1 Tax=Thermosulfurimonas sp. F29 TaxID=2867247 RepID=UPI001C83A52C|nr:PIN domain-containing protein [Thermosulfurimonas sp. F29]MBX6422500.1 PIN domain-containing protein [Thermosulfurimonas sp. F29]
MFLLDTNIFLEIALSQEKKDICKHFIKENGSKSYISDFSLHSIGVILFRYNQKESFVAFVEDILSKIRIISLPLEKRKDLLVISNTYDLDYDDSYQVALCKEYDLQIVTMDKDFKKAENFIKVLFL